MANVSVLTFYSFGDQDVSRLGYEEAWNSLVMKRASGVSCRNVFGVEKSPSKLSEWLHNISDADMGLFLAIENEFSDGADFMFIHPETGAPIDGFYINDFLLENRGVITVHPTP